MSTPYIMLYIIFVIGVAFCIAIGLGLRQAFQ